MLSLGTTSCTFVGIPYIDDDCMHGRHTEYTVHVRVRIRDILMYDESSTELDVSMAHPWSKDILNRASKEAGYAAERREMRKKSKYDALSVQDGTTPNLVPLVFEHFGFWG